MTFMASQSLTMFDLCVQCQMTTSFLSHMSWVFWLKSLILPPGYQDTRLESLNKDEKNQEINGYHMDVWTSPFATSNTYYVLLRT